MHSVKSSILAICWIIGVCRCKELSLKIEPTEQHVNVGGNVSLDCVWNSPVSKCFWKKDDELVKTQGNPRYVSKKSAADCSLAIIAVQQEDEGRWMCGIDHPISLSSKEVVLSVNETELTKRSIVVHPQHKLVSTQNETVLSCGFSSSAPHCFWSKNGDIVVIKGRYSFIGNRDKGNCSINIANAQLFDDGVWQCGYPRTDTDRLLASKQANVSVVVLPSEPVIVVNGIKMKNGSTLYVPVALHDNYRISCWSENGSPAAGLQWGVQSKTTPFAPLIYPQYVATYRTQVFDNVAKQSLKIAHLLFYNPQMNILWNQYNLICRASHPAYNGKSHDVSLYLVIGYRPPERRSAYIYG